MLLHETVAAKPSWHIGALLMLLHATLAAKPSWHTKALGACIHGAWGACGSSVQILDRARLKVHSPKGPGPPHNWLTLS
eukprot:1162086-Pelagomonas_calceolata.AAC.7